MDNDIIAFIDTPSASSFLRLREDVLADRSHSFYNSVVNDLQKLLDARQYEAFSEKFSNSLPAVLLSPRAHLLAALAAEQQGDAHRAGVERRFALACLQGLQAVGDGSRERPYPVTCISDEYDVLAAQGKTSISQRLHQDEHGVFDVHECDNGANMWFDITPIQHANVMTGNGEIAGQMTTLEEWRDWAARNLTADASLANAAAISAYNEMAESSDVTRAALAAYASSAPAELQAKWLAWASREATIHPSHQRLAVHAALAAIRLGADGKRAAEAAKAAVAKVKAKSQRNSGPVSRHVDDPSDDTQRDWSNVDRIGGIRNRPTINSIRFDTPGWTLVEKLTDVITWTGSNVNQILRLRYIRQPPNIAFSLENEIAARSAFENSASQKNGSLLAFSVRSIGAVRYVLSVAKVQRRPSGVKYVGQSLMLWKEFSFTIEVECSETIPNNHLPNDPLTNWSVALDHSPKHDADFPDHPLSVVRFTLWRAMESLRMDQTLTDAQPFGPSMG